MCTFVGWISLANVECGRILQSSSSLMIKSHMFQIQFQIAVMQSSQNGCTVYPKKYAHGFVVLCFVVVMQSFIMNSHEVLIHIHQGCHAGTGAIVRLPQWQ